MSIDPAYAVYVWGAYGLSALVLGGLVGDSLLRARRWRRAADARDEAGR
jgi:heme exporter protein CcmD